MNGWMSQKMDEKVNRFEIFCLKMGEFSQAFPQ